MWVLFACIVYILVLYTYLHYTHIYTTHFASYIKALVYFILWEIQYIHSVFLTWYQSHCSNFLVSCSLVFVGIFCCLNFYSQLALLVPSLDYSTAIKGPQGWIFAARSSFSATKTTAIVGSITSDLQLQHETYHRVYCQPIYSTQLETSTSELPRTLMRHPKSQWVDPHASRTTRLPIDVITATLAST